VVHALSELDPATRIFAQHEIANILFQAQTGELRSKHSISTLPPSPVIQPQQQTFQPISRPNIIPRPSAILKSSDHHFFGTNSQPCSSIPSIETSFHHGPRSSMEQSRGYADQCKVLNERESIFVSSRGQQQEDTVE
jgi:hypothetical protein